MPEVGRPSPNQWYLREDTGETFLVTDFDEDAGTVEIQTADGALDELDEEAWESLPLSLSEPPHDVAAPMDTLDFDEREGADPETDAGGTDTWSRERDEDRGSSEQSGPDTQPDNQNEP